MHVQGHPGRTRTVPSESDLLTAGPARLRKRGDKSKLPPAPITASHHHRGDGELRQRGKYEATLTWISPGRDSRHGCHSLGITSTSSFSVSSPEYSWCVRYVCWPLDLAKSGELQGNEWELWGPKINKDEFSRNLGRPERLRDWFDPENCFRFRLTCSLLSWLLGMLR